MILKHLDKDNLHHAYLIEGKREEIIPEILVFMKSLGINTSGNNSDFCHIAVDSFKIEDARFLKFFGVEKGFTSQKKIFIISANSFLLEAQNSLLKIFEEPIENTHFFVIVPDINSLLKTLVSRFYLISTKSDPQKGTKDAEEFIVMSLKNRIDFIKELLKENEEKDEKENEIVVLDSARSKALKFLNEVELALHQQVMLKGTFDTHIDFFSHILKVREFLRMPGSSTKSLMESVALIIPNFQN
ncbi:hypothetical protein A3C60_00290 [Candidatus Nomurabacteria bacterium RIFCSPHIGHO2_02_FULL_37_45]|uniref:DNA polymerase III delta N-terminal domain-containing protein n=2 Tax=Candidatus Nomuraibacteriota TaxID=1752729 RepID=A0A1F6Y4P5_9BACT|nr:MAG: hypothetical protein A2727_02390 [Candidatus Nomurabacteria bacterium RIFCSPHIGHO2_01_FULL_37_110]OGI71480.1 MAG: hypothetical protein A3C60_00290 [Candidatus Nomurabacteria bacterium RIFCSPHIGHO2_02_FULL_37_45]OGI79456.1 MAG: hypothetical protein A3F19_00590 [Candidatus Nomurabacteria bacterium RIFCSPHIGHO2_12_FULL_37_29]OGI84661.1 MAG: hypothetical protein A3A92_02950 [Candidatus Nomurabacteria bacterium RIFCSPLOWO2_01_FULL_37_49]OGJ01344.1 MAG: hypothetical protein A3G98_00150 [Candi